MAGAPTGRMLPSMNRIRRIPTPSLVIAILASVAACAGSATAASLITGSQIKDGTITGKDVKDHSIAAADLKAPLGPAGSPVQGAAGPAGAPGAAGAKGSAGAQGPAGPSDAYLGQGVGTADYWLQPNQWYTVGKIPNLPSGRYVANVHTTFIVTDPGSVLCVIDPPGGLESQANRTYIGAYAWSGLSMTYAFQGSGDVELKCIADKQWHPGTPEMDAIKFASLHNEF